MVVLQLFYTISFQGRNADSAICQVTLKSGKKNLFCNNHGTVKYSVTISPYVKTNILLTFALIYYFIFFAIPLCANTSILR